MEMNKNCLNVSSFYILPCLQTLVSSPELKLIQNASKMYNKVPLQLTYLIFFHFKSNAIQINQKIFILATPES